MSIVRLYMVVSSWFELFPSVGKRAQPPCCVIFVTADRPALFSRASVRENSAGMKEGMTPNPHGPLMSWATRMLQWPAQRGAKPRGGANPIKTGPSSDWSLQLDSMKLESLVIADQNAAVNTFSSLVLKIKCAGQYYSRRGLNSLIVQAI